MRVKKKERKSKALHIALLFGVIVGLLVGISLCIQLGLLISKSHFDGQHQFILQVVRTQTSSTIFVFSPDTHTITILNLKGSQAALSAKNTIELPVDASMREDSDDQQSNALIHQVLVENSVQDNLNVFDRIKLLAFSQTVSSDDITTKSFSLPIQQASFDPILTSLTTDQTLYKEGMTIAVVNASGISGLGNNVAKILTHVGGNVISVTSSDAEGNTSSLVYAGTKTYTVRRVSSIVGITPEFSTKAGIADITLTVGKDKGKEFESFE